MTPEELEVWMEWLALVTRTIEDKVLLEQLTLDTKLAILESDPLLLT